jgi:hypothetical protein
VSDTSWPASSAPTRCRPAQMYCGLSATGQRPVTVGPSQSSSTWSVAGSSVTNRRFFSTCRALPKVRKAARAKRLRFGGPSAGSCGQARVRSRACHRPRLDRTRKRRCVSNAPQTVPVPRPSLARCWSNADTAAAMTAAPSRPREPSRCACCRTIAAAKASNSSARGTATRATAMS